MASSPQGSNAPVRTLGRGFASMDPERQREVVGYVRPAAIETAPPVRAASARTAKPARLDWMRVQPDRESSNFEGSSSRHSR
jgi:hypothetical protein